MEYVLKFESTVQVTEESWTRSLSCVKISEETSVKDIFTYVENKGGDEKSISIHKLGNLEFTTPSIHQPTANGKDEDLPF